MINFPKRTSDSSLPSSSFSCRAIFFITIALLLIALNGCGGSGIGGGGGGGDDFVGAANVNLTTSPRKIDTGDRTRVEIKISNVIDQGILLKVRYPSRLSYAADTARIRIDSEEVSEKINPAYAEEKNDWKYLVFIMPREMFGDYSEDEDIKSEKGILTFQLIGNARISNGRIEADADVDDPAIPNNQEFDINNPQFEAETESSIEVTQSSNQ